MAVQPVSLAVFEAFQHKLFSHLGGIDRRFEAFEQAMNSRFVEMGGQIDALAHRLLRLEDEYVAIKEGLGRLEAKVDRLEAKVDNLSERVSRVEARLDELVAAEPRYALRADVQDLRARVEGLETQIGLLQKRVDRQ